MFKNAKKLADNAYLIVGVCADEEATPYKRQPVMNTHERTMTALGCRAVDEVIEASPLVRQVEFCQGELNLPQN